MEVCMTKVSICEMHKFLSLFFTFQETWEPSHIVNVWLPEPLYFHCFDLPCVGALKLLFASLYNLHLGEAG